MSPIARRSVGLMRNLIVNFHKIVSARDVFGSGGRFLLQTFIKVRHEKNEGNVSANGIALVWSPKVIVLLGF